MTTVKVDDDGNVKRFLPPFKFEAGRSNARAAWPYWKLHLHDFVVSGMQKPYLLTTEAWSSTAGLPQVGTRAMTRAQFTAFQLEGWHALDAALPLDDEECRRARDMANGGNFTSLYKSLITVFEGRGDAVADAAHKKLKTLRLESLRGTPKFVTAFSTAVRDIRSQSALSTEEERRLLKAAVDDKVITDFEWRQDPALRTATGAIAHLNAEFTRWTLEHPDQPPSALVVTTDVGNKYPSTAASGSTGKRPCAICGRTNHKTSQCRQRAKKYPPPPFGRGRRFSTKGGNGNRHNGNFNGSGNSRSGKFGGNGNNFGGRFGGRSSFRGNVRTSDSQVICWNCGNAGHYARHCPQQGGRPPSVNLTAVPHMAPQHQIHFAAQGQPQPLPAAPIQAQPHPPPFPPQFNAFVLITKKAEMLATVLAAVPALRHTVALQLTYDALTAQGLEPHIYDTGASDDFAPSSAGMTDIQHCSGVAAESAAGPASISAHGKVTMLFPDFTLVPGRPFEPAAVRRAQDEARHKGSDSGMDRRDYVWLWDEHMRGPNGLDPRADDSIVAFQDEHGQEYRFSLNSRRAAGLTTRMGVMPSLGKRRIVSRRTMADAGYIVKESRSPRCTWLEHECGHVIPIFEQDGVSVIFAWPDADRIRRRMLHECDWRVINRKTGCHMTPWKQVTNVAPKLCASNVQWAKSLPHMGAHAAAVPWAASPWATQSIAALAPTLSSPPAVQATPPEHLPSSSALSVSSKVTMDLFHQRCCHYNDTYLQRLSHLATGAPAFKHTDRTCFCPACVHAKQHRRPVPKVRPTRAIAPFLTVWSDIMFVKTPALLTGSTMSVVYVCDYSRLPTRYFMGERSSLTLTQTFDKFLREVVQPFGFRVTLLSTDRDKAYYGNLLDYCAANSIATRYSPARRHELNGVAERANRTDAELTRALLVHALKPLSYWQLAMETVIYVRARMPCAANPGFISPFEMVSSKLPNVSYFRVWGCPAYELSGKKWPSKATPKVFVGYPRNGPGWVLFDPATNHLSISIDVEFDESFARRHAAPGGSEVQYSDLFHKTPDGSSPLVDRDEAIGSDETGPLVGSRELGTDVRGSSSARSKRKQKDKEKARRGAGNRANECSRTPSTATDMDVDSTPSEAQPPPPQPTITPSTAGVDVREETAVENALVPNPPVDRVPEPGERRKFPEIYDGRPVATSRPDPATSGHVNLSSESETSAGSNDANFAGGAAHRVPGGVDQVNLSSVAQPMSLVTQDVAQRSYNPSVSSLDVSPGVSSRSALKLAQRAFERPLVAHYADMDLGRCALFVDDAHSRECRVMTAVASQAFDHVDIDERSVTSPTLREALASPERQGWVEAIRLEYADLCRLDCWDVVRMDRADVPNIVTTKWVLKKKYKNGRFERYKARLVLRGFTQVQDVDYFDTYSPVSSSVTIRLLLTLAAAHDLELAVLDERNAFIQAEVDVPLYIWPPEGYAPEQPKDGSVIVYKCKRSWYGIKQAPRLHNQRTHKNLTTLGFVRASADQCLYTYTLQSGEVVMWLVLVVDDMLIAYKPQYKRIYDAFLVSFQTVAEVSPQAANSYCGMEIRRNRPSRTITLRQSHAVEKLLQEHRFADAKPESAPAVKNMTLTVADCPADGSALQQEMTKYPYREIVGSCLYFAVMTRPDIAFVVNSLARFGTNPGKAHWNAVRHLLRYLRGTSSLGLVLGAKADTGLVGLCDASWASDADDRHSTSGYGFEYRGSLFAWWSRNQFLLARSSFEAELIALYGATAELVWIRNLLADFKIDVGTTPIGCDNSATISQLKEHTITKRTRHIAIRFFSTSEFIRGGIIDLVKVNANDNAADMLTKAIDLYLLLKHRRRYLDG